MSPFVLVKVAPNATIQEEEAAEIQECKKHGVSLSSERGYYGPEREKSWARVNFALAPDRLAQALRRLAIGLDSTMQKDEGS